MFYSWSISAYRKSVLLVHTMIRIAIAHSGLWVFIKFLFDVLFLIFTYVFRLSLVHIVIVDRWQKVMMIFFWNWISVFFQVPNKHARMCQHWIRIETMPTASFQFWFSTGTFWHVYRVPGSCVSKWRINYWFGRWSALHNTPKWTSLLC